MWLWVAAVALAAGAAQDPPLGHPYALGPTATHRIHAAGSATPAGRHDFVVAATAPRHQALHLVSGSSLSVLHSHDLSKRGSPLQIAGHPDGYVAVSRGPDDSLAVYQAKDRRIVEVRPPQLVRRWCDGPYSPAVQQAGAGRLVLTCAHTSAVCAVALPNLDAHSCTGAGGASMSLALSPDSTTVFVYLYQQQTLQRFTIDDTGALSAAGSLNIKAAAGVSPPKSTSTFLQMAVRADGSVLMPLAGADALFVVDPDFTGLAATVATSPLGCSAPASVSTSFDGALDVVVACTASNGFLVFDNSLTTSHYVESLSTLSPTEGADAVTALVVPGAALLLGGDEIQLFGRFGTLVLDGGRVILGAEPETAYLMASAGADAIWLRTGTTRRHVHGTDFYFAVEGTVVRHGCGRALVTVRSDGLGVEVEFDDLVAGCMEELVSDSYGMAVFALESGELAALYPLLGGAGERGHVGFEMIGK